MILPKLSLSDPVVEVRALTAGQPDVSGSDSWASSSSCDSPNLFLETRDPSAGRAIAVSLFCGPPGLTAPSRAAKPGYKAFQPCCPPFLHTLQPWFPNSAPSVRHRMIASHLLAYFFTELNHDQVQKVSKPGRGSWLASEKVAWSPPPPPAYSSGSRPEFSLTPRGHASSPCRAEDVEKVWAPGKLLGTRSHVR